MYRLVHPKASEKAPNPQVELETVLEENPKWKLLERVIGEVRKDFQEKKSKRTHDDKWNCSWHSGGRGPANVLVMVKDDKTLDIVRQFLVDGKKRSLTLRWLRYLEQFNDKSRSVASTKNTKDSF